MIELNKIYHGNCLDIMKNISNNSIDLIITSPPYDNIRDYKGYFFDFKNIVKEFYRIIKNGGIIVWVVADSTKQFTESLTSFKQSLYFVEEIKFNLLDTMIYEKNGGPAHSQSTKRYVPIFEYMFIFSKGKPKTFNAIRDKKNKSFGKINKGNTKRQKNGTLKSVGSYMMPEFSMRTNIWRYDVGKNKDTKDVIAMSHPARFPEKLAQDHILSWSNKGDLVLDPMCGSGTTCKQAKIYNRNFIGIEIAKDYVNIAQQRLKNFNKSVNI